MLLRLFLTLACSSSLLLAQIEEGGEEVRQRPAGKGESIEAVDGGDKESDGKGEAALANLTPEERLERSMRRDGSSFCRFVASVRPSRLLPGQTGTMFVTAILQGNAVLQAPSPIAVTSPTVQGLVSLGGSSLREAAPGRVAPAYLGRPVYDNTAILEIPVTMASHAKLGERQSVRVDLKFDLYDGTTTQVIGRFLDRAATDIEVGLAADPSLAARAAVTRPAEEVQVAAAHTNTDAQAAVAPAENHSLQGNDVVPAAAVVNGGSEPVRMEVGDLPEVAATNYLPLGLGAAALVLGIVVLLLRRK